MFFLCLSLKKARDFGKFMNCLEEMTKKFRFFWVVSESRHNLGEMTKKGRQIRNFAEKMWKFFCGPRTEAKFFKWSASRKRLRTAGLKVIRRSVSSSILGTLIHAFICYRIDYCN